MSRRSVIRGKRWEQQQGSCGEDGDVVEALTRVEFVNKWSKRKQTDKHKIPTFVDDDPFYLFLPFLAPLSSVLGY